MFDTYVRAGESILMSLYWLDLNRLRKGSGFFTVMEIQSYTQ